MTPSHAVSATFHSLPTLSAARKPLSPFQSRTPPHSEFPPFRSMGCSQSKIENEESLRRCKERKFHMTAAVSSRNAFAAAHSAYAIALKNTGAALHDFAQGEAPHPPSSSSSAAAAAPPLPPAAAAVQPPLENLPPPPPPVPDFNLSPLQRSASMPDLALPVKKKPPLDPDASILEEDEDQDEDEIADALAAAAAAASPPPPPKPDPPKPAPPRPADPPPGMESTWDYFFGMGPDGIPVPTDPPPPEDPPAPAPAPAPAPVPAKRKPKVQGGGGGEAGEVHHKHAASAGAGGGEGKTGMGTGTGTSTGGGEGKRGRMVAAAGKKVSFLEVMNAVDEDFLKAYESAHAVSKMLEATRMHYHSNFADNRGHIDHAARVMRVITWNRSLKLPNQDDGKDDINSDDSETHATILDKMLAWEKKLYDEMKAGELMKIEYQRKVALLNKQKKRSSNHEALERTKSAVSHLHTRYIVDMQSMDSTVSEISHLRDNRLYPKLVELVDGMANMWGTMYVHHSAQLKAVSDLRYLDAFVAPKDTSEQHHEQTIQLFEVLREWHSQFEKLMTNLKAYIGALNSWLKLNLIPIESSLKEKVSSPPRIIQPAIQILLHAWHDQMEKLPDALARGAIYSFSEVVHTIVLHQEEELKHREKCEKTRREYMRESRNFDDWYHKQLHRAEKKAASSTAEAEEPERGEGVEQVDPVEERRIAVETIKVRLESEVESHQRMCKQVREKSLASLKTHLPELFRAMSDFAHATSEMYKSLRSISQNQTDN